MSTFPVPTYNDANFRLQFPQFADTTAFPELQLQGWWDMGTSYINILNGYPWSFNPAQLQLAADLMCAHLGQSFVLINSGQPTVVVQGSAEGTVNVTLTPPPVKTSFGWWLATTAYGQQLRALLRAVANVGLYVGGSLDRYGFRGAGGYFG
jgi:hypothetical protein